MAFIFLPQSVWVLQLKKRVRSFFESAIIQKKVKKQNPLLKDGKLIALLPKTRWFQATCSVR